MSALRAVGIDLGGTKVEACLVDESGAILARHRAPSEPAAGEARVIENVLAAVRGAAGGAAFGAAGIGTPGTFVPEQDRLLGSPHTPLYETPGFVGRIEAALGVPLAVENDASCLALAEWWVGCRGRYSHVLAIIMGTGFGSGLILGDRLYRGRHGAAGEIGHTTLEPRGRACECGRRGCVEAYLSGPSLARRYAEATGRTIAASELGGLLAAGDAAARELMEQSASLLARLLADAVNLLDLDAIVLGGGVSNLDLWYEEVPAMMKQGFFGVPREVPLLRASLGDSAGVLGAALLGLRALGAVDV